MPMWTCDFAGCEKPAVRNLGDCILCNRHLCSQHLQHGVHECPKWEDADRYDPAARAVETDELTELIKKINTSALAARSVSMTELNGSPPAVLRDYLIQSEVATLKFLERTNVPAPKVFDFVLENAGNSVGVGYILMEKLHGKSLRWSIATQEQRIKVMEQLADVFIELTKYPFNHLGSLHCLDDFHVSAFARELLADFVKSGMQTMGPFSSLEEYHKSEIRLILNLILREEIYLQRAVNAYLIHRLLLDLVPIVFSKSVQDDQRYYLKHVDDKGDHIMVDEDFNITGIIDWEWAHTAPPTQAFNYPLASCRLLNSIGPQTAHLFNAASARPSAPQSCSVNLSGSILGVAVLLNLASVISMAIILARSTFEPLVTLGDSIRSFLRNPDPTTADMCLLTKTDVKQGRWGSSEAQFFVPANHFWAQTPSPPRWMLTAFAWLAIGAPTAVAVAFLVPKVIENPFTPFGVAVPHLTYLLPSPVQAAQMALFAALPQLFLAMLYFVTNSHLTTYFLSHELSLFALGPRPLRVSSNAAGGQNTSLT
ncbi:hypothetical protein GL218_05369 [Daldinia childiae]|uniref:uncharacterized protein n=1 Tax=Daldinia childiae TaxID=326645 RepID=UPI0014469BC8|nr:uncharacterized protein GL218_05369 [Daldinia childiae]KAF3058309.1 hypothetical protein GL218_05369 [Daldinia childiae]